MLQCYNMSIKIFFLLCLWICTPVFAQNAQGDLAQLLGSYTTYQAHFSQVSYDEKNKAGQKSEGQVYMSRPGKFRWETTQPYQQILIANGDTLWIYDVDLKQATQRSLSRIGFNPAELLISSTTEVTKKYAVEQEDSWYKLTPKQENAGFKEASLQFQNGKLEKLKILNQLNQTNIFTFTDVHINPALSPSLFQFKPPAGVQVLKE